MGSIYLGIDLGGSNISAALMTPDGKIISFVKTETLSEQGPKKIAQRMIDIAATALIRAKRKSKDLKSVGIGVPGVLDIKKGLVKYSPNLPGWKNIHLRNMISSALKKPVYMDNDANVAAFGEKWMGAGQGYQNVVVYTLGTGVGGGIIQNGTITHGATDGAGELGHMTILIDGPRCNCGNHGCLETLASGTAIAREGQLAAKKNPESLLASLNHNSKNEITAKRVFEAARKGDLIAHEIIRNAGMYLGIGVANVISLLNPQIIIIGGGVSKAGEMLLKYVRAEAKKRTLPALYRGTKIVRAELIDRAGVIGAAGIAIYGT